MRYRLPVMMPKGRVNNIALGQRFFGDRLIVNNGYDLEQASAVIASSAASAVSFGRSYVANPDLVERFRAAAPLAPFDPSTLYAGGAKGYSDYPAMAGEPGPL